MTLTLKLLRAMVITQDTCENQVQRWVSSRKKSTNKQTNRRTDGRDRSQYVRR